MVDVVWSESSLGCPRMDGIKGAVVFLLVENDLNVIWGRGGREVGREVGREREGEGGKGGRIALSKLQRQEVSSSNSGTSQDRKQLLTDQSTR